MNDFKDNFNQACIEVLEEIKKIKPKSQRQLNKIKLKILSKHRHSGKIRQIPKNADIYLAASESERQEFRELLSLKPVRTISGVAPIALMSEPYPCPHAMNGIGPCSYCPGGPGSFFGNVPQSYTGKEPSARRAIRNNYDPYLIVFNRLEHYVAMGRMPDKAEIIIQGGTFAFFPKEYQEYFVKYTLKAMNDFGKLFFNEKNNLDLLKFKRFFELPRVMSEEDSRIKKIQKRLLCIKHLDLGDLEAKKKIEELFFDEDFFDVKANANNGLEKKQINNSNEIDENPNINAIKSIKNKVKAENIAQSSLKQIQKENETSFIRCIGLTIETKSDFGKLCHGNLMLELGCTRVELGIQSVYDNVLTATNRGNTTADNIDSIRVLKDLGFKVNCHYMLGLPLTTREMDLSGLRQLFENPDYKPDMLKIYPCMVMEGTRLYDEWKAGKFKPLATEEAADIIAEAKRFVPEFLRIVRIQRDIPTYATSSGVDRTNLRQYIEKLCKEKGIKCKCIRCREAGINQIKNNNIQLENMQIKVTEYDASHGKEFFIAAEDEEADVLFGYCRLRLPSQFLRKETTEKSALIRELHVYSAAVQIGKKSTDSFQHRGIGKQLMAKAEGIAKEHGRNNVVVLAGIGAREYFRKLGYVLQGAYMSKRI